MTARAKVFMSGRSQAVRLPKEFRFSTAEVRIRREGSAVVLEPLAKSWEEVFAEIDAIKGSPIKRPRQPKPAKRLPIR
jgi:antitoxin VapB